MAEYHDDETLSKVLDALVGEEADHSSVMMCFEDATDAVRRMQNAGILFRQRIPDEIQMETTTEVSGWVDPTEMLLTRNQEIRSQAIDIAVRSITPAENFSNIDGYTQRFIDRAEMFEEYIRNGVIHNG